MGISWNEVEEAAYLMRDEPGTIFTNAQNKQKLWVHRFLCLTHSIHILGSYPLRHPPGSMPMHSSNWQSNHCRILSNQLYSVLKEINASEQDWRCNNKWSLRDGTADKLTSSPWPPSPPAATAQSKASAAFQMTAITSNPDDAHYLGQHLASNYATVIT